MRPLLPLLLCALSTTGCVGKKKFDVALAENSTLATRVGRLEGALSDASSRAEALEVALDKAQARATELDRLASDNEAANDALQLKLQQVQGALSQITARSGKDRQRKEELEGMLSQLEASAGEAQANAEDARSRVAEVEAEVERLRREKAKLEERSDEFNDLVKSLESEIDQGLVKITELSGKTTVNLSNAILFDSGKYGLKEDGKAALIRVAGVLAGVKDRQIVVEGHTDNVPVSPGAGYADNWALSALRASAVVALLVDNGVAGSNIAALGVAEHHPVGDNATVEGRAANRRIEVTLAPRLAIVSSDDTPEP